MDRRAIVDERITDLVRQDARVVRALADLGISPRYVDWTVRAAADDLGANLDRVVGRIAAAMGRVRVAAR